MSLAQRIINKIENTHLLYVITIFFLIAVFVYGNSLFNGFVWDDEEQVLNNTAIRNLSNIPYLFTTSTFNTGGAGLSGLYYKPLMPLFFSLNYAIWELNPFGFHLFDLILHFINVILIFVFFKKIFTFQKLTFSKTISFFLSLIFLLHPASVESVAYISSTQELLYTFFLLLALLFTFSFCRENKEKKTTLLFINFSILLSLLSKESGIITIPIVIIFSYLFSRSKLLILSLSSFLTFIIYLTLRFGIAKTPLIQHLSIIPIANATLKQRIQTIPYEIFSYIRLIFSPKDLFVVQHVVIKNFSDSKFYLSLLISLIFFIILIKFLFRSKSKLYLFFLLWLFFSFFILLNLYPLDMTIAERWLYGPMIGILGLLGVLINYFFRTNEKIKKIVFPFIVVLLIFALRTNIRTINWKNNLSLFSNDIQYSKDSFDAQNNYGVALFRNGEIEEAKKHFEESITLSPKWWTNYSNLGVIYQREGKMEKAKNLYQTAIKNGNYYLAYENLALLKINTEKPKEVIPFLNNSLLQLPYNEILNKLAAIAYYKEGATSSAKFYAEKAYKLNPSKENLEILQAIINLK